MWAELVSVLSLLFLQQLPLTSWTVVTTTPYTPYQRTSTAKCTLPASVSGKAYSVTPVVFVPRTVSSTPRKVAYNCDPIPAASINKGNFQFACKSLLGKDVGDGIHTISWVLPTAAGISIEPYTFDACPPSSRPTYVVNTALAKTTLLPKTVVYVDVWTTTTRASTTTVSITSTSTCFVTSTAAPVPVARFRRAGGVDLQRDPESLLSDSAVVDADAEPDLAHDGGNGSSTSVFVDLKERAAAKTTVTRIMHAAAKPVTIGKPDFTYPPYGVTTVYVKSISTSTWTYMYTSTVYNTTVTSTQTARAYTIVTVTVTRPTTVAAVVG